MPTAISTRISQLPELRKRISQASHEDRAAAAYRLQAAKKRISNPTNWTQFTAARDASGDRYTPGTRMLASGAPAPA